MITVLLALTLLVGLVPGEATAHPVDEMGLVLHPRLLEERMELVGQLTMSWGQAFFLIEQETGAQPDEADETEAFVEYISKTLQSYETEIGAAIAKDLELRGNEATCSARYKVPDKQAEDMVLGSRRVVVEAEYSCERGGDLWVKNDLLMDEYSWQHNDVLLVGEGEQLEQELSVDNREVRFTEAEMMKLITEETGSSEASTDTGQLTSVGRAVWIVLLVVVGGGILGLVIKGV